MLSTVTYLQGRQTRRVWNSGTLECVQKEGNGRSGAPGWGGGGEAACVSTCLLPICGGALRILDYRATLANANVHAPLSLISPPIVNVDQSYLVYAFDLGTYEAELRSIANDQLFAAIDSKYINDVSVFNTPLLFDTLKQVKMQSTQIDKITRRKEKGINLFVLLLSRQPL